MHEFKLGVSRLQLAAVLAIYALAVLMVAAYLEASLLKYSLLCLLLLLAWRESRIIRHARDLKLALNMQAKTILLEEGGQPYFFSKYKVYPTRWFAILSLVDQRFHRTICLDPQRFQSAASYRHCRFLLRQMERSGAA